MESSSEYSQNPSRHSDPRSLLLVAHARTTKKHSLLSGWQDSLVRVRRFWPEIATSSWRYHCPLQSTQRRKELPLLGIWLHSNHERHGWLTLPSVPQVHAQWALTLDLGLSTKHKRPPFHRITLLLHHRGLFAVFCPSLPQTTGNSLHTKLSHQLSRDWLRIQIQILFLDQENQNLCSVSWWGSETISGSENSKNILLDPELTSHYT